MSLYSERTSLSRLAFRFLFPVLILASTILSAESPDPIVYVADPPRTFVAGGPAFSVTPSQCVALFGQACYTPSLMRTAYNVPPQWTGRGQTIVIVDAFGSPTIREDLETFSAAFGLPAPDLQIVYPEGRPTFNPLQPHNEVSWAFETSLDVEWAHAIAPDAKLVLVVAPTNSGDVLYLAERFAVDRRLGNVMSLSFGALEAATRGFGNANNVHIKQAHAVYEAARNAGITVFAVAGDNGASNRLPFANALFPASDPLVTSVGGTDLYMTDAGTYVGETVWNDSDPALCPFGCAYGIFGATGGAPSFFPTPPFQQPLGAPSRLTADVSYNAGIYTGVLTYASFLADPSQDGFYIFGGTSAGAPQWAALTAIINQATGKTMGYFNPTLYAIAANPAKYAAAFHDVTIGHNALFGPGFSAGPGYDLPTGLGTPNVAGLIDALK